MKQSNSKNRNLCYRLSFRYMEEIVVIPNIEKSVYRITFDKSNSQNQDNRILVLVIARFFYRLSALDYQPQIINLRLSTLDYQPQRLSGLKGFTQAYVIPKLVRKCSSTLYSNSPVMPQITPYSVSQKQKFFLRLRQG